MHPPIYAYLVATNLLYFAVTNFVSIFLIVHLGPHNALGVGSEQMIVFDKLWAVMEKKAPPRIS